MEVWESPARYYPEGVLPAADLAYWIAFSRVVGIGPVRFKLLYTYFKEDMAVAWHSEAKALAQAGLDRKTIESFLQQRHTIDPPTELKRLEHLRVRITTWKDPTYPQLLKQIPHPPHILYTCGALSEEDNFALAIVGTRKITSYGQQVTEHFARELAANQVTIVSGLAQGIDTVAHQTALATGGRTIAVLASGLESIYPRANIPLARQIVDSKRGALISEFPLGVKPEGGNFPARNRIISGLSLGVLVTEAPASSGALITARFAQEQGRDVFAVPGSIFAKSSGGTNRLIQDGAHPTLEIDDIIKALNLFLIPQKRELQAVLPENDEERSLLALLSHEPQHINELIQISQLPTTTVTSTLMMMELKGMIKQLENMQFVLAR